MNFVNVELPIDWDQVQIISHNINTMRVYSVFVEYADQYYKLSYNIVMDHHPLLFACNSDGEVLDYNEIFIDMYGDSDLYQFREKFEELINGGNQ